MMSVLSKPSYESNGSDNYSLKCFQLWKDKGMEPSELGFLHCFFDFYAY